VRLNFNFNSTSTQLNKIKSKSYKQIIKHRIPPLKAQTKYKKKTISISYTYEVGMRMIAPRDRDSGLEFECA